MATDKQRRCPHTSTVFQLSAVPPRSTTSSRSSNYHTSPDRCLRHEYLTTAAPPSSGSCIYRSGGKTHRLALPSIALGINPQAIICQATSASANYGEPSHQRVAPWSVQGKQTSRSQVRVRQVDSATSFITRASQI